MAAAYPFPRHRRIPGAPFPGPGFTWPASRPWPLAPSPYLHLPPSSVPTVVLCDRVVDSETGGSTDEDNNYSSTHAEDYGASDSRDGRGNGDILVIDDALAQAFARTAIRRKERRSKLGDTEPRTNERVGQRPRRECITSTLPTSARLTRTMKDHDALYGAYAGIVREHEADLNLAFDESSAIWQPRRWPLIPLRRPQAAQLVPVEKAAHE
mmetsp:Transcript_1668/g.4697  ORF Transcript_1668/g.4697 Transcript_1668/m.4697 type:complete len:211 (+) Transcript_1668:12-644(+)